MTRRFWSNVLAVAYKETLVLRHDRAFLMAVMVQPIIMLLLYGLGISNKPANVPWAVLDRSQSALSRQLVEEIRTTPYFLVPEAIASYDDARRLLGRGTVVGVLVIPASFGRDVERGRPSVQLLLDGTDPLTAARVGGIVAEVAGAFEARALPASPGVRGPVRSRGRIDVRQRFWFNPTLRDRNFFLSALVGMLLTNLCLSASSLGLVGERESGTYEQLLALPTSAIELVLGKLLPYVGVCYVVLVLATLGTGLAFGIWPVGNPLTLVVITLPFVLASLAIGVFVSSIAKDSAQAVFISVFFILPSFVLSGVMMPYQLMPPAVRVIGGFLPLRWYQIASRRVIERGAGLADVVGPTLVLVALFVAMLLLIRWRMKPRLG
jgi:ABC-2 type transport system permease protein